MLSIFKIYSFLNELNFIINKKNILIAFSSGQDSIFLLFCLYHFSKNYISLQYCHHFLQPSNFLSFWQTIQWGYCLKKCFSVSIYEKKDTNYMNEKEARIWRYNSIKRNVLLLNKNLNILTGHTGSDFLETFFWYIFREFFLSYNLKKNSPKLLIPYFLKLFPLFYSNNNNIIIDLNKSLVKKNFFEAFKYNNKYHYLINDLKKKSYMYNEEVTRLNFIIKKKPLQKTHRQDITYICKNLKLPLIVDKSNNNLYYYRNRIRHLLFPLIKKLFKNKLQNFIKICQESGLN